MFKIKKKQDVNMSIIEQLTVLIGVLENHEERIKKLEQRIQERR